MTIIIKTEGPVPQGTDLIGLKDALAYVLEIHKLTVGRIDIQEDKQ